jgi:hypothetical protein
MATHKILLANLSRFNHARNKNALVTNAPRHLLRAMRWSHQEEMRGKLIISGIARQIVLLADLPGLLMLYGLQLGTGGDAMAEAAAVGAAAIADGLVELVGLCFDGGEEGGHLLLSLDEQMLEVSQHSLVHLHIQKKSKFHPRVVDPGGIRCLFNHPGSGMSKKSGSGSRMNNPGMGKKSGSRSGMNNKPDHISKSLEAIFFLG